MASSMGGLLGVMGRGVTNKWEKHGCTRDHSGEWAVLDGKLGIMMILIMVMSRCCASGRKDG